MMDVPTVSLSQMGGTPGSSRELRNSFGLQRNSEVNGIVSVDFEFISLTVSFFGARMSHSITDIHCCF